MRALLAALLAHAALAQLQIMVDGTVQTFAPSPSNRSLVAVAQQAAEF